MWLWRYLNNWAYIAETCSLTKFHWEVSGELNEDGQNEIEWLRLFGRPSIKKRIVFCSVLNYADILLLVI